VFALCAADAARVYGVAQGFDRDDPYSRSVAPAPGRSPRRAAAGSFRFALPRPDQLEFFGDAEYARGFREARERLAQLGGEAVEIDFGAFLEAGRLLYEGPWLAERYTSVGKYLEMPGAELYPVTREILAGGTAASAVDAFRALHRLQALRRETASLWREVDFLATPTAGTIYRIAEIDAQPIALNANLGRYTTFANLLELAAVAVPAGFRGDGLPFGITLLGPAGSDLALLQWADRFHRTVAAPLGALASPHAGELPPLAVPALGWVSVAVCGAHMEGLPLNPALTDRGGVLLRRTRTAPAYRLYALPGAPPQRPGLVRDAERGAALELEVWDVPVDQFGSFVAGIPAPLGIGKIELEDGSSVSGFLCEGHALVGAAEITSFGGWRPYLARDEGTPTR
jgi:allophanate hydrolase